MEQDLAFLPYSLSNIAAVLLVISAMLWPTVARIALGCIFVAAFAFNIFTAIDQPHAYLYFGEHTNSRLYRSIIFGLFSKHVQLYVSIIAFCQLLIGIFIGYNGVLMKIAMAGAIIFLLAICPLGYGAAFPAPLVMAMAVVILLTKKIKLNVVEIIFSRNRFLYR